MGKKIIFSLSLFFAWLLSIPFNGPILFELINYKNYEGLSLSFYFGIANALGLLIVSFYRSESLNWPSLMIKGNITCLVGCISLLFLPISYWGILFFIMGLGATLFIIGWSYPFVQLAGNEDFIKTMALIIIISNVLLFINVQLLNYINGIVVFFWALLPLLLIQISIRGGNNTVLKTDHNLITKPFPKPVMIILVALIFGLYINGGFLYGVIYPSFTHYAYIDKFYRLTPYLLTLLVVYRYIEKNSLIIFVYLSSSFMGLAFVFFSLFQYNLVGYLLTATFIQGGFALLDLFVFSILGRLAYNYGYIHRIFGLGLAANVGAIVCGELVGEKIIVLSSSMHNTTSLFAVAIIFITLLLVPWLSKKIDIKDIDTKDLEDKNISNTLQNNIDMTVLTPRESEIVMLIIQGYSNKDIADQLFISPSTLKNHIRNIYQKLGIGHKRELISKALSQGLEI